MKIKLTPKAAGVITVDGIDFPKSDKHVVELYFPTVEEQSKKEVRKFINKLRKTEQVSIELED